MRQQQESYLLRREKESNNDFFSWLSCCTGYQSMPVLQEAAIDKPILTLKKPIKQRLSKNGVDYLGSSKENTVKGQRGNKTDRKSPVNDKINCLRFSQYQPPRNIQNRISSNSYQPNSQIRFSYGTPADAVSSRRKEPTASNFLSNFSVVNSNKIEHIVIKEQVQEQKAISKLYQRLQAPEIIIPNVAFAPTLEKNNSQIQSLNSPRPKKTPSDAEPKSGKSTKKLKKVKSKEGGRLSLKMRQVVSIRQPQEDSDHESIVIEQSDDGLFGKLKPIRQYDRQSHCDGHYKDSFLS